ncbi:complex I intermediate-associated protein 30-domain-containing protein, partial [Chiua virens]
MSAGHSVPPALGPFADACASMLGLVNVGLLFNTMRVIHSVFPGSAADEEKSFGNDASDCDPDDLGKIVYAHPLIRSTYDVLRMEGANPPSRASLTLLKLHTQDDISTIATGMQRGNRGSGSSATARFRGEMRLAVKPEVQGRIRGGYAGFRTKVRLPSRPFLADGVHRDLWFAKTRPSFTSVLRLRLGGDPRTRNSYYVNLQTDGPVTTDLWQHRLYFKRNDGGWEDIFIPFDSFILTNTGELVQHQITMFRQRIRTVGISMLGGNSGVSGCYDLGIHSIRAVNEEDVSRPPMLEKDPSQGA